MQTQWRGFLRALAEELDSTAGPSARDTLLRAVGRRMAQMVPVPAANSLETLELEFNEVLCELGWGSVRLDLLEADRRLVLTHGGLPRLGAAGEPPGTWLAAVLEGLYEGWMVQQPGSEASLHARLQPQSSSAAVVLHYGRL